MGPKEQAGIEHWQSAADAAAGSRLAHALVELTQAPMTATALADVLSEVSVICQAAFWEPVAVSISLGEPSSPELVATASRLAQGLDGAQLITGEGPHHDAWTQQTTVSTTDLHRDQRWPRLGRRVADSAVCAAVSSPIRGNESVVGTVNVYSALPQFVNDAALENVEMLASAIAAVVHGAQVKTDLEAVATQLRAALRSRAVIDQAKGVLMAVHSCTADEAFSMLVEQSQRENVKLRDIAKNLLDSATRA